MSVFYSILYNVLKRELVNKNIYKAKISKQPVLYVLLVFAEFGQTVAQVATISKLVPIVVGDGLTDLYRSVEVPVARRELATFLQIQWLRVGRSECAKPLPQFLLAMLQPLSRSFLCKVVTTAKQAAHTSLAIGSFNCTFLLSLLKRIKCRYHAYHKMSQVYHDH